MTAHQHAPHAHAEPDPDLSPTEYWEQRYSGSGRIWSGKANRTTAEIVSALTPGHAIDLGCGEGGDVLWLAEQGWQAHGLDISATAVGRAREEAAARGLTPRPSTPSTSTPGSRNPPRSTSSPRASSSRTSPWTVPRSCAVR
jgi:SAM-dependent methyltransferase